MPKRLARWVSVPAAVTFLTMLVSVSPGAGAQEAPTPTVSEIVVDSFNCDTGDLNFHVFVTDLPYHTGNGSLGYSIVPRYEQGSGGAPGRGFNIDPESAPYTGEIRLHDTVPLSGEAWSEDDASGPITEIYIHVGVADGTGNGLSDSAELSYPVDCDAATVPTSSPDIEDGGTDVSDTPTYDSNDTSSEDNGETATDDDMAADESDVDTNDPAAAGADSGPVIDPPSDADTENITTLPSTGTGSASRGATSTQAASLLIVAVTCFSLAVLRLRGER